MPRTPSCKRPRTPESGSSAAASTKVPPVMVAADGTVTKGTYCQTKQIEGGYSILELATYEDALRWAAKIAAACRCSQEVRAFQHDPES